MKKATLLITTLLASASAFAADEAATKVVQLAAARGNSIGDGMSAIGLALLLGLGVLSATAAQGKVGAAALDGLARNPQAYKSVFTPMIITLALIESLFILTWLVANSVVGKF